MRARVAQALGLPKSCPLVLRIDDPDKPSANAAATADEALELLLPRAAFAQLRAHKWPGNLRELAMVLHNVVAFTLVSASDALQSGLSLRSPRLQVDPGLIGELLSGYELGSGADGEDAPDSEAGAQAVHVRANRTLNAVSQDVERQYMLSLLRSTAGDLARMAELLLGDASRTRAVRLRLNQLGVKLRELRGS